MNLSRALRLGRHEVITLVGGGGKTTLMFRLANELTGQGLRVVTTMTTRIFVDQMRRAPAHLVARLDQDDAVVLEALPAALDVHGHVLLASDAAVEAGKVAGLSPELIDAVAALPSVDVVIVEGDGSRRLPLKAPAPHEPVIPGSTTLVVPVVGLDVLGRPFGPDIVHRAELVTALTGAQPGDPVTPDLVARLLGDPHGGLQHVPAGARVVPFLNKADDPARLAGGRATARLALACPRIDAVAIGAAEAGDPVAEVWSRVAAVVLAAGAGRRFGGIKQALPWHGRSLVAHVASQALSCPGINRVVVTLGAGADEVRPGLAGLAVDLVPVPDWEQGQSRSVQAGLAALARDGQMPAAALFLLADQPAVTPELLTALIERHRTTGAPIVAPRYAGQRGNPVLFDRSTFPEFASLTGDIGARPVLQAHAEEIAWLDWPTPEITRDLDTLTDYRAALADGTD